VRNNTAKLSVKINSVITMTWTAQSGKIYNLCLLDTNVISEILKYPKNEGRGFLDKFPPINHAPCFTIYNILEIKRNSDVFNKFMNFFSIYPCFLLKPYQLIIEDEKEFYKNKNQISPLFNAFTSFGSKDTFNLKIFINKLFKLNEFRLIENDWRNNEKETLESWLKNKSNFIPTNKAPNSYDAERYIKEAGLQTLIINEPKWSKECINNNLLPDINYFPSIKTILYSIYYRLYDESWKPKPGEITDVMIMSIAPYVDSIITEKFQYNIFMKICNKVKYLDKVNFYKIKDIRFE
jgi:hypothetical protein